MKKIKKAIIPAAGLGTRFLPFTKSVPKEMLPIVDTPTIQYLIEEIIRCGIRDILLINGRNKVVMINHFDRVPELEAVLIDHGKTDMLEEIRSITDMANIYSIRQKQALGLGHAVLCAKEFVGDDPFVIVLGDDVIFNEDKPPLSQLIDAYEQTGSSIIGVQKVPKADVNKYGIVETDGKGRIELLKGIVEKPPIDEAPSDLAVVGRYILVPEIFEILEKTKKSKDGEIQLTDAIETLLKSRPVYCCEIEGRRYDMGSKEGFLEATIEFGLRREDLKDDFLTYLSELFNHLKQQELI